MPSNDTKIRNLQDKLNNQDTRLSDKQDALISAANIKTINGKSVLGSGDLTVTGSGAAWGQITGTLSNQNDLNTVLAGKEPTKGTDDNYVTDAEKSNLHAPGSDNQDLSGKENVGVADSVVSTHAVLATGVHGVGAGTIAKTADITKTAVGLGNVDNTTDTAKPVSIAQQTALDLKANLASPIFTGSPNAPTPANNDNSTKIATTAFCITQNKSAIGQADLAIANTETMVCQVTFAANELVAGETFMFRAYATRAGTTSAQCVARIRVGTTLLSGNIAAVVTSVASTLAVGTVIEGMVTVRTAGASGTILGSIGLETHLAAVTITKNIVPTTTAVAVNTTTANIIIGLTFISGNAANTFTFRNAIIWRAN